MVRDGDQGELGGQRPAILPELDGLRGLAILPVIALHACGGFPTASKIEWCGHLAIMCGWAGVDLFFVLSGFLITRILLRAKGGPGYFASFYWRRILRIFPVYYAALFLMLVVGPALSADWRDLVARRIPWTEWIYASNLMIGPPPHVGVIHFWSLAVEEHFYLVWPFLVWLLTPRALVRACGALIAFAFALRWGLVATHHEPMDVYGFTPARIDTIAWGALLALMAEVRGITPRMAQAARRALPIALLALVPIALHDRGLNPWGLWTQRFGLDAVAVAATSLVVIAVTTPRGSRLRGVLVSRPMRAFGRYSYGMYIYHLPILTFVLLPLGIGEALRVKLGYFPGVIVFYVVTTTLCAGLAIASFELFETRFLRLKGLVTYGARRGIESTTVSQGISG